MSELQPNCEWVPVGAMIYPDDFMMGSNGRRMFSRTFDHQWTRATAEVYQREKTVDPCVSSVETKIVALLPKDRSKDTESQEQLRWRLRKAKLRYAETLGEILKQMEGGE
jgi:hypothetical protein